MRRRRSLKATSCRKPASCSSRDSSTARSSASTLISRPSPKDARGRFLKGLILAEQNKPNDAIKIFTELTQEFPELPEPYNNLAVLYASQGQYDKARSALEMAIRTHPSYATAHENLGDIYAKMASQAYDKALQLDKANAALQTKLNLIKDLFSNSPRLPKVTAIKPDTTKVAVATPSPKQPEPASKPAGKTAEPVAKPVRIPEPAKPARNEDEVLKAVNQWARAWSENDVAGYLRTTRRISRHPRAKRAQIGRANARRVSPSRVRSR